MPKNSAKTTEIIGPEAKPATSKDKIRPRLRPKFSGSATIITRRSAGKALPAPKPIMMREMKRIMKVSPSAMPMQPITSRLKPKRINRLARPRSASGAMLTWPRNDVKKPTPTMNPSADSAMPKLLRKSSSIVNITPYRQDDEPIAKSSVNTIRCLFTRQI